MGIMATLKSVPSLVEASVGPTGLTPNTPAEGPVIEGYGPDAITSGSELDRTAVGPWPLLIDAGIKIWNSWRPNGFHNQIVVRVAANYGSRTSAADFGQAYPEYSVPNDGLGFGSVGLYPSPVPNALRPTYDNLETTQWGDQVLTPKNLNPQTWSDIQQNPTSFVPGGTASLGIAGEVLQ